MSKRIKSFKHTTALNSDTSPSTGSVTAYCGKSPWPKYFKQYMFLEVSDCHSKVRLHTSQLDTKQDFIKKMRKLHKAIGQFIEHLESN